MDQTSEEYLNAHGKQLGRVVIGVGLLDNDLSNLLSDCFCLNAFQENALVRPLSTRAKAELLVRIAKLYLDADNLKLLTAWERRIKSALDERNSLIHGAPGHKDGEVHFRSYGGKNRMLGKSEAWPIEKVSALAGKFAALADEIEAMHDLFETFIESSERVTIERGSELAAARDQGHPK